MTTSFPFVDLLGPISCGCSTREIPVADAGAIHPGLTDTGNCQAIPEHLIYELNTGRAVGRGRNRPKWIAIGHIEYRLSVRKNEKALIGSEIPSRLWHRGGHRRTGR
jgi:hypothetical protein